MIYFIIVIKLLKFLLDMKLIIFEKSIDYFN